MKKIIISCVMLCVVCSTVGWAQVVKGTKYWGAGVSLSGSNSHVTQDNTDYEYKGGQISFAPSLQFGNFYKTNRLFGVELSTTYTGFSYKSQDGDKEKQNSTRVGLSPFLRQYKTLGTKWFLFLQEAVPLGYTFHKNDFNTNDKNGFDAGITIKPGVSFKVSDRFLIESDINLLSLGLIYSDQPGGKSFSFQSSISSGIQSTFGIRAAWFLTPAGN